MKFKVGNTKRANILDNIDPSFVFEIPFHSKRREPLVKYVRKKKDAIR